MKRVALGILFCSLINPAQAETLNFQAAVYGILDREKLAWEQSFPDIPYYPSNQSVYLSEFSNADVTFHDFSIPEQSLYHDLDWDCCHMYMAQSGSFTATFARPITTATLTTIKTHAFYSDWLEYYYLGEGSPASITATYHDSQGNLLGSLTHLDDGNVNASIQNVEVSDAQAFSSIRYEWQSGTSLYSYISERYQGLPPYSLNNDLSAIELNYTFAEASPVPEPETYAMLLVGLGMIGFTIRRRESSLVL